MTRKLITNCKYELKFNYYVQDDGKIFSERTNKILSVQLDKDGYEKVQMMSTDGKRHRYSVHRLVLENFNPIENMNKFQVNHIDGNKRNNNLFNLEWVTCSENLIHAHKIGLKNQSGEHNNASKLTEEQVKEIINMLLEHKYTYGQIAEKFRVSDETIGSIKRKERWKYLTENIDFD